MDKEGCSEEAADSGRPSKEYGIFDKEPACRDQFRHHARIIGDETGQFGGSLIKPTAILTDGAIYGAKKFTIYLGTIFPEEDDSAFKVESIWALPHPQFNEGNFLNNNIAVILLNVEVPLGRSIWPVKLPYFDEVNETFTGRRARISGFGRADSTDQLGDRLRFSEVTVISNDLCKRFFKERDIPDSTLCAGNPKPGFCHGDYGGALVIKSGGEYKQIGVAIFHSENCEDAIPGVYTRVTSLLEWIRRAAGNLDDWRDAEEYYCN